MKPNIMSTSMKRRAFLALACAMAARPAAVLHAAAAAEPVIAVLQSELGVTNDQAIYGLGALLTLAQQRLVPQDFRTVANAVPNGERYVQIARMNGIVSTPVDDADGFMKVLDGLGVNPQVAERFAPTVINFLARQANSADAGELLVETLGM
jgi:hypothetical protein